jgi:transcriptional regulator with XRE-family HTH domain
MITEAPSIEARMAAELRRRREELGLSLGGLSELSGVSKAMIGKIEAGGTSPTASLLGRLCAGLGITLSALMAAAEDGTTIHVQENRQASWLDPETGLERRVLMPRSPHSAVEIARIALPAHRCIDYPVPPARPLGQHLLVERGALTFTLGDESFELRMGDALFAIIDRATRFATGRSAASYLVVQESR